ncbi:MAG: hypothetical protein Q7S09_02380 [bacterium]|nr:hypothetical protein [bacterium]
MSPELVVGVDKISIGAILGQAMAKSCVICGKTSYMGVVRRLLRGHYNPTAKKRKYPNLQWFAVSNGKRVKACTKCIRAKQKTG